MPCLGSAYRRYHWKADGRREAVIGYEPAYVCDGPQDAGGHGGEDGTGVEPRTIAHHRAVDCKVDDARNENSAELGEHQVQGCAVNMNAVEN